MEVKLGAQELLHALEMEACLQHSTYASRMWLTSLPFASQYLGFLF